MAIFGPIPGYPRFEENPAPPRAVETMPENPAIYIYGHGPAGECCGTCNHLGAERPPRHRETPTGPMVEGRTEYSCRLQSDRTHVTWDACAAFVPAEPTSR